MLEFLICLMISVILGYGMAILLVEKGDDWPIKPFRDKLQTIMGKIHPKLPEMLSCTTCTSFWTTLVADIVIGTIACFLGSLYFFWPFSGLITAGLVWTIIEYLNTIDKGNCNEE
jgi:hypothetical protein